MISGKKQISYLILCFFIFAPIFHLSADELELTGEELSWIATHPLVRIRVVNRPPFQMYENGEVEGFSVDYLRIIFDMAHIKYEFVTSGMNSWPESRGSMERWESFDMIPSLCITKEHLKYMIFTEEYLSSPWVIFIREDSPYIAGMESLTGKTVAVQKGFAIHRMMTKEYPDINLLVIGGNESTLETIEALATGQADAFIGNLATGSYYIMNKHLHNLKVASPAPFGNHIVTMGIRKDWPELASIINKGLRKISPETEMEITERYFTMHYDHGLRIRDFLFCILPVIVLLAAILTVIYRDYQKLGREVRYRMDLQNELSGYITLVDQNILTFKMDTEWTIVKVSDALCRLSGFDEREQVGKRLMQVLSELNPEYNEALLIPLRDELKGNRIIRGEMECLIREGGSFWMKYSISPVFTKQGETEEKTGYTMIGQDVTDRKKVETLSVTDKLTGLVNRMKLDNVFEYEIRLAQRGQRSFSVIICDLDRFKLINDRYGHAVGDYYLIEFARILKESVRKSDTVGRWGGDEFLILCPATDRESTIHIAEKLRSAVKNHYFHEAGPVTASFGIAIFEDGMDEKVMLEKADKALYRAKESGRDQIMI